VSGVTIDDVILHVYPVLVAALAGRTTDLEMFLVHVLLGFILWYFLLAQITGQELTG